jgi:hypothetical protein
MGMSNSEWQLAARSLDDFILVKEVFESPPRVRAAFYYPYDPDQLPEFTGLAFTVLPGDRFPYGYPVEPD